jgi:hypothetical protein
MRVSSGADVSQTESKMRTSSVADAEMWTSTELDFDVDAEFARKGQSPILMLQQIY